VEATGSVRTLDEAANVLGSLARGWIVAGPALRTRKLVAVYSLAGPVAEATSSFFEFGAWWTKGRQSVGALFFRLGAGRPGQESRLSMRGRPQVAITQSGRGPSSSKFKRGEYPRVHYITQYSSLLPVFKRLRVAPVKTRPWYPATSS
jgi:hypothetical protein